MIRFLAIAFGVFFIFIGISGFLPALQTNGLLFGYFETETVHNLLHIAFGVIGIMAATRYKYAKLYFQAVGIIYAFVTIVGFLWDGDFRLFVIHVNIADNILHFVIAIVALYLGFFVEKRAA